MRSYRDLCGIARALDLVGERWALLVVRELLFGPKRFADLHRGLPGLSQNVLTQRLRELEDSGVVTRRRALPPGAGLVYALTDHGRALEPILLALGRWGSPLAPLPGSATELSPDALVVALRTTFDPVAADDLCGSVQLHLPGDAFHLVVNNGGLDAVRGEQPPTPSSLPECARSRASCSTDKTSTKSSDPGTRPRMVTQPCCDVSSERSTTTEPASGEGRSGLGRRCS